MSTQDVNNFGMTADHWKVLTVLNKADKPLNTKDIVKAGFKNRDNADRVVRNAFRLLKSAGVMLITAGADRGTYKPTTKGATAYEELTAAKFNPGKPGAKKKAPAKKAAPKKVAVKKKAAPKKVAVKSKTNGKANGKSKKVAVKVTAKKGASKGATISFT